MVKIQPPIARALLTLSSNLTSTACHVMAQSLRHIGVRNEADLGTRNEGIAVVTFQNVAFSSVKR